MYVVVPKASIKDFETTFEKMATYVVPRSAKLLAEDSEYGLYAVVIFKKSLDEFKASAREKRAWRAPHSHRARDATRRGRAERGVEGRGKHALDDPPHRHAQALAALVVGRGTARRVAWVARHAKWRHPRRTAEGIDNNSVSP